MDDVVINGLIININASWEIHEIHGKVSDFYKDWI